MGITFWNRWVSPSDSGPHHIVHVTVDHIDTMIDAQHDSTVGWNEVEDIPNLRDIRSTSVMCQVVKRSLIPSKMIEEDGDRGDM